MISDKILWCDLETTGTNENHDDIIEAGFVITDARLNEIDHYQAVYYTPILLSDLKPAVQDMHVLNGLWAEVLDAKVNAPTGEQQILDWLRQHVPAGDVIPLGGSGVSHFDRRFIDINWPRLSKRLTYWSYDIGSVRRVARLAGVEPPMDQGQKPHRALADVYLHIKETRWYLDLFYEWSKYLLGANG